MIGQTHAKALLRGLSIIPQFIIVSGPTGSGKSLFIQELCKTRLNCEPIEISSIDDVRGICEAAVDLQAPTAYVLSTFDTVNFRTKEAILKLCEETPKYVYIFIETVSSSSLKQTLLSRAFLFNLEPYSTEELKRYCLTLENATETEIENIINVFNTPGNIKRAQQLGSQTFLSFCNKVANFIGTAPLGNALKISSSLKLKNDSPGYDLDLFFNAVSYYALINRDQIGLDTAYNIIKASSKITQQLLQVNSLNKQMLFDSWLLSIRGIS